MLSSFLLDKFRIQFSDVFDFTWLHFSVALWNHNRSVPFLLGWWEAGARAKNLKRGGVRHRQKAAETEKATSNNNIFNVKIKGSFQNYFRRTQNMQHLKLNTTVRYLLTLNWKPSYIISMIQLHTCWKSLSRCAASRIKLIEKLRQDHKSDAFRRWKCVKLWINSVSCDCFTDGWVFWVFWRYSLSLNLLCLHTRRLNL